MLAARPATQRSGSPSRCSPVAAAISRCASRKSNAGIGSGTSGTARSSSAAAPAASVRTASAIPAIASRRTAITSRWSRMNPISASSET